MKEGVYHLEVLTVSRGDGRSAPGAIAYRAGIAIEDMRTGEKFDYRRKRGIRHTEIVLPKAAPKAYEDRAFLWNEAERVEKHPRATVARELVLAIPAHLSKEQQLELVRKFVQALVDKHQVAIDFAIHDPHEKDSDNVHVHVMMTTRRLTETGFTEKTREWDDIKKLGPQTTKATRKLWADLSNAALTETGIAMFIDHRSHKDRGLETAPTKKMGVAATAMEKRGIATELGDANRAIRAANAAIKQAQAEYEKVEQQLQEIYAVQQTLVEPTQQAEQPESIDFSMPVAPTVPELALTPEQLRANKERQYAELAALYKMATEYGENRAKQQDIAHTISITRREFNELQPPRFGKTLRALGLSDAYDDYEEKRRHLAMHYKQLKQDQTDLAKRQNKLKPAMHEWDYGGKALQYQRLQKELGYDKPSIAPNQNYTPAQPPIMIELPTELR